MKEDRFIKYLKQYATENQDINTIPRNTVVTFEGEPLKIGEFLATIRKQHKLYINNSTTRSCATALAKSRYEELDKLNFIWEPGTIKQQQLQEKDVLLDYVTAYYDQHQTFANIPEQVVVDDETYNIRNFINHLRANHRYYLKKESKHGSMSPTFLRRYEEMDKRNFEWNPKEAVFDDKQIRYLKSYYQEHQTLEGVPKKVEFEGEKLNINVFLTDRRKRKKRASNNPDYKPSPLELARWAALDEMNYDWDFYERRNRELLENDPFIRYLEWHYNNFGTINNIPATQEVEFEGKVLKIGRFINDCRKKHRIYTTEGMDAPSTKTPLLLKRYADLDRLGLDWRPSESSFSLHKYAHAHGVRRQTLKKYIKRFDGNLEKATKFCEAARRHDQQVNQNKQAKNQSLSTIMTEFEVDLPALQSALNKKSLYVNQPPKSKKVLTIDGKTTLREYCIDHGLNYAVIRKAIKLKQEGLCEEDLQSLINRVVTEYKHTGQHRPSTWIYSKYGHEALVRHLLLSMHLDPSTILRDMSKNCISLEKAIENNCFIRNADQERFYLAPLYHDAISYYNNLANDKKVSKKHHSRYITSYLEDITEEYHLTDVEQGTISEAVNHYIESIHTYKLYNVGFEKDPKKRLVLIMNYQLTDQEIEEAFFLPLQFDQKVMIGRDSELYARRMALKDLTKSWPNLSEEEKTTEVNSHYLTGEEIKYVIETSHNLETTKEKVHTLRKK